MSWNCAAIDHGITIFPFGKIGPCCQIKDNYLKPVAEISNPNRFSDLKTETAPPACEKCAKDEYHGIPSYRKFFNSIYNPVYEKKIQFVDIRNDNTCNLKCRYCGPHFSSAWAKELGTSSIRYYTDIEPFHDELFTNALNWLYFTGGEPLFNSDHWLMLEQLIESGNSKNISLMYNSNLTVIKYKDKNVIDIWKQFKDVTLLSSIDAVGKPFEYIRSGACWETVHSNLQQILMLSADNIKVKISPVLSILNIWFIDELYQYAQQHNLEVVLNVLTGPDYLSLNVLPDDLKLLALEKLKSIKPFISTNIYNQINSLITNNINDCLFPSALSHILLLDNNRNEKLFDLLPFKLIASKLILANQEYNL
jgi:sulfatase maturation enzyme AslB (radical SAM superfamily)